MQFSSVLWVVLMKQLGVQPVMNTAWDVGLATPAY
jgi:hypothetical protein